jgi:uncharacterized protein DUF6690
MLPRSLMIPTLLVASISAPYIVSNAPEWIEKWDLRGGGSAESVAATNEAGQMFAIPSNIELQSKILDTTPKGPGALLYPTTSPLEGVQTMQLAEVVRMDVTKEWVYTRWARKSTAMADLQHYSVRVPLVTGTQLKDLAGSLTYLFGADGRCDRISFRGRTGDTTELVMLVTQKYHLLRQPTLIPGEQLYQLRRKEDVISQLRTRPAPVLWSSSPHNSYSVELELQRSDAMSPLPAEVLEIAQRNPAGQPQSAEPQPAASGTDQSESSSPPEAASKPTDPAKRWRVLFPRSQVPSEQIKNLTPPGRGW